MGKQIPTSTGLIIVFAAAVIIGGGSLTYFYVSCNSLDYDTTTTVNTSKNKTTTTKDNKTYQDADYKYSFQYPTGWTEKNKDNDKDIKTALSVNKSLLDKIYFVDAITQKKIDCVRADSQDYSDISGPTKNECVTVLQKLSAKEKEDLNGPQSAQGLYAAVMKNDTGKDLKTWLTEHLQAMGGELVNYTPGKEITMAGLKGYASQSGCCAGYDFSYVVQKGDLVYEMGTYWEGGDSGTKGITGADEDNSLVADAAKNFKITE